MVDPRTAVQLLDGVSPDVSGTIGPDRDECEEAHNSDALVWSAEQKADMALLESLSLR